MVRWLARVPGRIPADAFRVRQRAALRVPTSPSPHAFRAVAGTVKVRARGGTGGSGGSVRVFSQTRSPTRCTRGRARTIDPYDGPREIKQRLERHRDAAPAVDMQTGAGVFATNHVRAPRRRRPAAYTCKGREMVSDIEDSFGRVPCRRDMGRGDRACWDHDEETRRGKSFSK